MSGIKDAIVDAVPITPENENYFFGYYDLNAYDSTGKTHLCARTDFIDRIPAADDVLTLGRVRGGVFEEIAQTTAWNFQQGALLQYMGGSDDTVFYNIRHNGGYATVKHNTASGEKLIADCAAGCISPDGRYGLGINFARIFDFRKGYGYCGIEDAHSKKCPSDDGIFLIDFASGKSKLIISYEGIKRRFPSEFTLNEKILVNHITFNKTSDRFLFLLRNFPDAKRGAWATSLITADLDGNMHMVMENSYVSHYAWRDSGTIVAFCAPYGKRGLFEIKDISNEFTELKSPYADDPTHSGDIHCLYSPDGRYILGDGYPDSDGYRPLFLYELASGRIDTLLRAKSLLDDNWEIRCDLHARFSRDGKKVSFDTVHTGKRQIYEFEL